MWTLFTTALARGSSTTQVSILNTSSNFLLTAVLGFAIFAEALPPLWWVGAALLVAGNVIAGRGKEDTPEPEAPVAAASTAADVTAGVEGPTIAAEVTAEELAANADAEESSFVEVTPPALLPVGAPEEKADEEDNLALDLGADAVVPQAEEDEDER
jgi:hypothetical protein